MRTGQGLKWPKLLVKFPEKVAGSTRESEFKNHPTLARSQTRGL